MNVLVHLSLHTAFISVLESSKSGILMPKNIYLFLDFTNLFSKNNCSNSFQMASKLEVFSQFGHQNQILAIFGTLINQKLYSTVLISLYETPRVYKHLFLYLLAFGYLFLQFISFASNSFGLSIFSYKFVGTLQATRTLTFFLEVLKYSRHLLYVTFMMSLTHSNT